MLELFFNIFFFKRFLKYMYLKYSYFFFYFYFYSISIVSYFFILRTFHFSFLQFPYIHFLISNFPFQCLCFSLLLHFPTLYLSRFPFSYHSLFTIILIIRSPLCTLNTQNFIFHPTNTLHLRLTHQQPSSSISEPPRNHA